MSVPRKNQSDPQSYIVPCRGDCVGVDLNRNYAAKWGSHEINKDHCGHIFEGQEAFSEIETSRQNHEISSLKNIKAYVSYHSFGEMILYPFSMSKSMTVDNKMELRFAAMSMMNAIQNTTGNKVSLIFGDYHFLISEINPCGESDRLIVHLNFAKNG